MQRFGAGGLTALGSGFVGAVAARSALPNDPTPGGISYGDRPNHDSADYDSQGDDPEAGRLSGSLPVGADAGPYGNAFSPPDHLGASALDDLTFPPPRRPDTAGGRVVTVEMAVVEKPLEVSGTYTVDGWTYNGSAPGPTIRATEGDLLRVEFTNRTNHVHNLHFHGRHSPLHDGWEPVRPGGETVYEIEAGPAGVHPYHCHTMPIDRHIAKGLYGTLIVDPRQPRPEAIEVVLALSGWDVNDDGRNELYSWNGTAGFYAKYPIKVPVGQLVRAYVLNMVEFDPIASFHLHATTFDIWPAGMGQQPAFSSDVFSMGQMERAILEFTLTEQGRYMFHPHQHSMAAKGAMGWFAAIQ